MGIDGAGRINGRILRLWSIVTLLGVVALSGCVKKEEVIAPDAFRGTVQGFVRDHATNAPLAGVTVTLFAGGTRTATTDSYGYWYFNGVAAEATVGTTNGCQNGCINYYVKAPAPATAGAQNYLDMMGEVYLPEKAASTSLITVVDYMVKTATVSGYVTDAATGLGLNGATVVLNTSDQFLKITPQGSNAAVMLPAQFTATTADQATSGAAGWYSLQVPALWLNLGAGQIGAYASGYEYSTASDAGNLNLQFASAAVVDFRLPPVDNNLGLVAANVSLVSGSSNRMQILRDAAGNPPANSTVEFAPDIDFSGATQMVFTLIFDQPVNTTQFYSDSIRLRDSFGNVVIPSMTATWQNNYTLELATNWDLQKLPIGATYQLITNRTVQAGTANTSIGVGNTLAQFHAVNSALNATVPTPALYLTTGQYDTALQAENGVIRYLSNDPVLALITGNSLTTTAENYTSISERFVKGRYSSLPWNVNAYNNGVDVQVPRTQANLDSSAVNLYFRVVNPASGETLQNWALAIAGGGVNVNNGYLVYNNLALGALRQNLPGLTSNTLRFGNRLDFAVTVKDPSGIETAIDQTKMLSLRDNRAPELLGTSLVSRRYQGASGNPVAALQFSEPMNTSSAAAIVNVTNASLFTTAPVWDVNGTTLYVNASSAAAATVYQVGAVAGLSTVAGNVITFANATGANGFFRGQWLNLRYADGSVDLVTVADVNSTLANPTLTLGAAPSALRFSTTVPFTVGVNGLFTNLRAPVVTAALAVTGGTTSFTSAARPFAVGDRILLRQFAGTVQAGEADVVVTVVSYDSAGGVVNFTPAVPATGATYDWAIFEGDVLRVSATDEAGNAVHGDADEAVNDALGFLGGGVRIR